MKNLFIDTNVLIDFLADRKPFSHSAAKLFTLSLSGKVKIYISAASYNNIYYILRQSLAHKEAIRLLKELSAFTEIVDVSKKIINAAMASDFNDFEDAVQYNSALTIPKIDCIITRDVKGFKKSIIPTMSTEEIISFLENRG